MDIFAAIASGIEYCRTFLARRAEASMERQYRRLGKQKQKAQIKIGTFQSQVEASKAEAAALLAEVDVKRAKYDIKRG